MKYISCDVLILESKNFFESDKRSICFSKTDGKISCLAKNAAKASKKKVWSLEPLTFATLSLFKGKSFYIITNYSITKYFDKIRESFNHLHYALFFMHICKNSISFGQPNKPLFLLMEKTLFQINQLGSLDIIKDFFYKNYLLIEGINPHHKIDNETKYLNIISNYIDVSLKKPIQLTT